MNEITNPKKDAKEIRAAIKGFVNYVFAVDARTGKEYRIVAAKVHNGNRPTGGQILGQEIRQGIWFPIRSWEAR